MRKKGGGSADPRRKQTAEAQQTLVRPFDVMHDEGSGSADSRPKQNVEAQQTLVRPLDVMHDEGGGSADSRRKQTASVETLIRLTGWTPLPMCLALAFVERVEHCVDVEGAVLGSTCFVCLETVDVDGTERVPFAKTGVCGLCQTSLLEERKAGDSQIFQSTLVLFDPKKIEVFFSKKLEVFSLKK